MPIIGDTQLQPVNVLGSFVSGMEMGRSASAARQQEALNALKMQQAQQEMSDANALRAVLARGAPDDELLRTPGGAAILEARAKFRGSEATARGTELGNIEKGALLAASQAGAFLRDPRMHNKQALSPWIAQLASVGILTPQEVAEFDRTPDDPQAIAAGLQRLQTMGLTPAQQTEQTFTPQNLGGGVRLIATPTRGGGPATVVPGSQAAVTMTPGDRERVRLEGRRVELEGQRVELERDRERTEATPPSSTASGLVKGTPEYEAAVTAAREGAKADVAFREGFPTAVRTAERTLSLLDTMLGDLDVRENQLVYRQPSKGQQPRRPAEGFSSAVGASLLPGSRFVPGSSAADFQAMHDQATGASFMEAFATLKGGGQITEKEGEKATAALNRMSLAQSEREYIRAAREFQTEVRTVLKKAQERFTRPAATGAPAPAADDEWADL
jgi:hypothetical protein